MKIITIQIKKLKLTCKFQVAENFNELNLFQLIRFQSNQLNYSSHQLNYYNLYVIMSPKHTPLKVLFFKFLTATQIVELQDKFPWYITPAITIPTQKDIFANSKVHGPGIYFKFLRLSEYNYIQTLYYQLKANPVKHTLNADLSKFCSYLYRSPLPQSAIQSTNFDGDTRVPSSFHNLKKAFNFWETKSVEHKILIFQYFDAWHKSIEEQYPFIFTASEPDSNTENFGFASIIIALAGTKYGDLDNTHNQFLVTILFDLKLQHKHNQDLKKQANNKSN